MNVRWRERWRLVCEVLPFLLFGVLVVDDVRLTGLGRARLLDYMG